MVSSVAVLILISTALYSMLNPNNTPLTRMNSFHIGNCYSSPHATNLDFVDFPVNIQYSLEIQYCPKPHAESPFAISLRHRTVFFFNLL